MATPYVGRVSQYDLTAGVKISMDEMIYLLSPTDLPMTLGVDSDGTMVIPSSEVDQVKFEWMDEEMLVPRTQLGATALTGDTFITITSGERARFSTGDLVRVIKGGTANEVMRVTGYGTTADTLIVTRGFNSTTATNYASGDIVMGIGTALAEGSDPENARSRDRDLRHNFTQIFGPERIEMSRTARLISRYGVPDEWAKQMYNRTREMWIRVENAYLYGTRHNDTSGKIRATGGLDFFLTTNVDSSSTELTVSKIATAQQVCYNRGEVPSVLIANPNSLGNLNDLTNTSVVRQTMTESRRGRARVELISTEFGDVTILRNRHCHPFYAFLIVPGSVSRKVLSPMQYEALAKTGDSDKAQLVLEEGLQVKGYQHMYKFTNLNSYTAA